MGFLFHDEPSDVLTSFKIPRNLGKRRLRLLNAKNGDSLHLILAPSNFMLLI